MSNNHEEHERPPGFWGSRFSIGFMFIGAVAGYLLLTEHLAHVVGALPFLLLLACPLMHVFMHHGHGHHQGGNGPQTGADKPEPPKPGASSRATTSQPPASGSWCPSTRRSLSCLPTVFSNRQQRGTGGLSGLFQPSSWPCSSRCTVSR